MEIVTVSPEETKELGKKIAALLQPGDVIALWGDLGAGKTAFTQGIGLGLEIKKNITSPTFNIIKEYQGVLPLYHFDLYRIEGDLEQLGCEEYFYGEGITIIEWPERAGEFLPAKRLEIHINKLGENERLFRLVPFGPRAEEIVKGVEANADFRN